MNAQTFVPTTPSNKNVLLEEYTGIYCSYCPDGHRMVNDLSKENKGRFYQINIHEGNFAIPQKAEDPDYRTPFGYAIVADANVQAFPMGAVNRRQFPGESSIALNRTDWAEHTATVLSEVSYVNVAAKSSIDFVSRTLTVDVEVYYTANAPVTQNNINVALTQNNIIGPQLGMSLNPEQIYKDSIYIHAHMLRYMLTGNFGDDTTIKSTVSGSFSKAQYTYTLPEHINDIPLVLDDLEVIVFVAEGRRNIANVAKSSMIYLNVDPVIGNITEVETNNCDASLALELKNYWYNKDITSINFEYEVYGQTYTYRWANRTITANTIDSIMLPAINLLIDSNTSVKISITDINDEPISITKELLLEKKKYLALGGTKIKIVTDKRGDEITWKMFDEDEQMIANGGPFAKMAYNGITPHTIALPFNNKGCYAVKVLDSEGDGINHGLGLGYIDVLDMEGNIIVHHNGKFKNETGFYLYYDGPPAGIEKDRALSSAFRIYPNPVKDILYLDGNRDVLAKELSVKIFDTKGQKVNFKRSGNGFDVSDLKQGVYFLRAGETTLKFVKL
ncbi:MAG: Omp28-related outer membrane protein [Bacteroidales bacterium]|nr:Omp28-related outer membrane protein [Bacteroidales bacterium]